MEIRKLKLFSKNIEAQSSFYKDVLGFPLLDKNNSQVRFQTGATELIFEKSERKQLYHFAFLIPTGQLEKGIDFLRKKGIELLLWDGKKIAQFRKGRAIYFYDPDGNIAEFIERSTLGFSSDKPFSIDQVLKINEIGLPAEDPLKYSKDIIRQFNLKLSDPDNFGDLFCWAGDYNGVFIVVKIGRNWKPTQLPAQMNDFEIEFEEGGRVYKKTVVNNVWR